MLEVIGLLDVYTLQPGALLRPRRDIISSCQVATATHQPTDGLYFMHAVISTTH